MSEAKSPPAKEGSDAGSRGVHEGSNLMDELRHVQLLLKREEIFEEFQQKEVKELNQSIRKECQWVLYLQKLLISLHFTSTSTHAVGLTPQYFESLFKEIPEKSLPQPPYNANTISNFNKVISAFSDNLSALTEATVALAQQEPEVIDQLTFSTIPALFGYLWSREAALHFADFMGIVRQASPQTAVDLTRVIFSLPAFQTFFSAVMGDVTTSVQKVDSEELAGQFVSEFIEKWETHADFCPEIIRHVIGQSDNPPELVNFLNEAFKSPLSFGIVPTSIILPPNHCELILQKLIPEAPRLWRVLVDVQSPFELQSAMELLKIVPDLNKTTLLTKEDLVVLKKLVEKIELPGVKPEHLDVSGETKEYIPYLFTLQTGVTDLCRKAETTEFPTHDDKIEYQLRKMLTNVDVIPLAAQPSDSPDMIELLKSQVQLARPDHRLLLEMKIDDFESARKSDQRWTFQAFLDLLREKFNERGPQRLDKLSKISLYNKEFSQMVQLTKELKHSIEDYRNILRFHIVKRWVVEQNPLQKIDRSLYESPEAFGAFFRSLQKQFVEWCDGNGYKPIPANEILHNLVMRELPIETYLEVHPDIQEMDRENYEEIIEHKDDLLKQNTFDFTSTFQENPKLLEQAQTQLRQAFEAPIPLDKLRLLDDALHTLVFVLTFEGQKEIGADQWLPMTILLLVLHEPKMLPSTISYIEHFVMTPFNGQGGRDDGGEVKLISEQIDYTFTMVKSAYMHFQENRKGPSAE